MTDIHALCGIRTRNPSKRAAADHRLRPRGNGDRRGEESLFKIRNFANEPKSSSRRCPLLFVNMKQRKSSGRFCILNTTARDVPTVASCQGVPAPSFLHKSPAFKYPLLKRGLHFFTPFVGESEAKISPAAQM